MAVHTHLRQLFNVTHVFKHFKKGFHKPYNAEPDFDKDIKEIVEENGFIFENHTVVTGDGYILGLFRVTLEKNKDGPVVFMQHGLLDSADCWVMHYPELAPAFKLVRNGFDVWLGN